MKKVYYNEELVITEKMLKEMAGRNVFGHTKEHTGSRMLLTGPALLRFKMDNRIIDKKASHTAVYNEKAIKELLRTTDLLDGVKKELCEYFEKDLIKYLRKSKKETLKKRSKNNDMEKVNTILEISKEIQDIDLRNGILNIATKYLMENMK